MFSGSKKYYYVLGAIFLAVVLLQYFQPKPIDWRRTYSKNDKIPFGCYAMFNLLDPAFSNNIEINQQNFYSLNQQTSDSNQALIIVNNDIEFSKLDVENLFEYLNKGNTVMMCATAFSSALKDTFALETQSNWFSNGIKLDSLLKTKAFEIAYVQPKNNVQKWYTYPQVAFESFFVKFDTARFKVTSINSKSDPVLLQATIGKGKLILCSVPDVFGNLFIVDHKNRFYTYTLLSLIANKRIVWDEYYKDYNIQQKGIFQFIFNSDALYMAYVILLLGLLFFMLFEIKRKQRPIPVITPLKNSTLEFIDVVSHVYYNSNNHKHIAEETIQYFYFDVRKKFHVNTNEINEEFYITIHKLSGISQEDIKKLFSYCENIKHAPALTENDLIELNDRINNFKQKSIR
ncbi:MAG: DUF4350 domain-containing protein [Bacteroidota bacterium]